MLHSDCTELFQFMLNLFRSQFTCYSILIWRFELNHHSTIDIEFQSEFIEHKADFHNGKSLEPVRDFRSEFFGNRL